MSAEPPIRVPWKNPDLMLTAGGVCAKCGFTYWEHRGHIIACPVCENERLRAVAEAACKAIDGLLEASAPRDGGIMRFYAAKADALKAVAAVSALERGEVKS
jgi:hypothetical protein